MKTVSPPGEEEEAAAAGLRRAASQQEQQLGKTAAAGAGRSCRAGSVRAAAYCSSDTGDGCGTKLWTAWMLIRPCGCRSKAFLSKDAIKLHEKKKIQ